MKDEIDRYKRLLEDWQGDPRSGGAPPKDARSSPPPPRPAAPPPDQRAKLVKPAPPPPPEEPGRYPGGTILVINDEELVVYRRPVAGKPFDMVYSLLADGSVKIEAIDLNGQQIHEMGRMDVRIFQRLQGEMRWTRKMVAASCANPEDAERIPDPGGDSPEPDSMDGHTPPPMERKTPPPMERNTPPPFEMPAPPRRPAEAPREESTPRPPQPKSAKIRRGQRLTVQFGNKAWEAVYWGRDSNGSVVAHNTHKRWTLMHLDLDRFKDTMILEPDPDPVLIEEISRDLATLVDFE